MNLQGDTKNVGKKETQHHKCCRHEKLCAGDQFESARNDEGFSFLKKRYCNTTPLSTKMYRVFFSELLISPAFCRLESPDNRLKSSRTEAAEVGAEEREQVPLFSTSGADGAETREQLSRESSAVRGSEMGRTQPKTAHDSQINRESTIQPLPQNISCYGVLIIRFQICVQPKKTKEMGLKSHTFY